MKKVCLLVKFQKDPEYKWTKTGGCFEEGKPVVYEQAVPFHEYDFRDIQIEVRLDHKASELFEEAVISPVVDQLSQNEDEAESVPIIKKDYDPQQAIEKMQSELYFKKSKGQIKSTGFYPIYYSLIFIARVFLALATLCIIALVFYMLGMLYGPEINPDEDRGLIDQDKVSQSNKPTDENELKNV